MKKIFMLVLAFFGLTTLFTTCNMNVDAVSQDIIVKDNVTYEKVTDVSEVTEGNYIFGADGYDVVAGKYNGSKRFDKTDSSESGITNATVFTFERGTTGFYIKDGDNYLYDSNKNIKHSTTPKGEAVIAQDGKYITITYGVNPIKYNTSGYFKTYAKSFTAGKNIQLFKAKVVNPEAKTYTVTLNTMGGNTLEPIVLPENNNLSGLPTPEKNGFLFDGWFKEESLTTKWDSSIDKLTSDITLYAKWVESPYITINSLEELESAEYYFGSSNGFAANYESKKFTLSEDINKAIRFTIYKITESKVLVSFISNGETKYLVKHTSNADIEVTNEIELSANNLIDFVILDNTLVLKAGDGRCLSLNSTFLRYYGNPNQFPYASFHKIKDSNLDINEFYMSFVETKASLKLDYKVDTLEATDVDLRFGTIVDKTLYNANANYGVVAVKSSSSIKLTQGLQDATNIADFVAKNQGAKNVEATPVEVANGYQFAWVINNIEEQELKYNEEFIAAVYMELDGKLYFATPKTASVLSVRDTYINDKLDIPANVLEVLKKLA